MVAMQLRFLFWNQVSTIGNGTNRELNEIEKIFGMSDVANYLSQTSASMQHSKAPLELTRPGQLLKEDETYN